MRDGRVRSGVLGLELGRLEVAGLVFIFIEAVSVLVPVMFSHWVLILIWSSSSKMREWLIIIVIIISLIVPPSILSLVWVVFIILSLRLAVVRL